MDRTVYIMREHLLLVSSKLKQNFKYYLQNICQSVFPMLAVNKRGLFNRIFMSLRWQNFMKFCW